MTATPVKNPVADWFRRWRSPLRKFLADRGAVRVADLDDIAQEVFLRLLRYESSEVIAHPQAYLLKIAGNVAAEWAIRARHRMQHDPRWLDTLVSSDSVEEDFDSSAVQREIKRAVTMLPSRAQSILKLHFEEGRTYGEIAAELGLTLRVVRRDFETSFVTLRRELKLERTGVLSRGRE